MRFIVKNPIQAFIEDYTSADLDALSKILSYKNTANQHLLKRHYQNVWLKGKNKDAWEARLQELKDNVDKNLLFNENGKYFIRPGSLPYLNIDTKSITNDVKYATPKKVPWNKPLPFQLHPYQEESVEKLINIRHGNVELCTGSGKSAILLKLCRETGFRTAIIAPSESIFSELLEKFEYHLGTNLVGAFGDGKKKIGKLFTICIADSIVNIKPGTAEWDFFSKVDMIAIDESHTWGADTLEELCHNIFKNVPYRMFLSGTQTRGDGAVKLLQSIIGQTVHTLTTKEAIEKGYICNHDFTIVDIESSNPNFNHKDALMMKRAHLLNNRNIAAFTAKLANASAVVNGEQTLVLVEELSQISMLIPLLKVPYAYAHSSKNKKELAELGLEKVDKAEAVEKFNKNEVKVLIGTSCISTGTNIYPTHHVINWVGGASEIKTKQGAVGRSVRKGDQNPWADRCKPKIKSKIYDFNVLEIYVLMNHLKDRISYYRDSGTEIKRIKLR